MSTDHLYAPIRRILPAPNTAAHNLSVIEATTALAACVDVELHALFVEDINLLRLAALSFVRETHLTSATTFSRTSADMARTLRAEAMRAQAPWPRWPRACAYAGHSSDTWPDGGAGTGGGMVNDLVALTFDGDAPTGLTQAATTLETVMRDAPCPLLMLPPGAGIRPPFVVVYDSAQGVRTRSAPGHAACTGR